MIHIKNGAPRAINLGIKDESTRTLPQVREETPQHLPLFYTFAERGPMDPQMASGDLLLKMYGSKTFEERSKFFTHATLGITTTNGEGNSVFVKRVVGEDAARAGMVFYLEVVAADIPQYQRMDGEVIRNVNGEKVVDESNMVPGYLLKWSVEEVSDITNLAGEYTTEGTMTGRDGEASRRYPMFAMAMGYGEYGNNVGIRLWFPGPNTADPTDLSIVESEQAMIYRAQWVERSDERSTPRITQSQQAEQFVDFALREGVVNPKTDQDLTIDRIKGNYEQIDPASGYTPVFGPIDDMYVYQDNIEDVLEMLHEAEASTPGAMPNKHMLNIFNCLDYNGLDHYSFRLDASSISLTASTTHYGKGGDDGVVGEKELDLVVRHECRDNWENVDYPLVDDARYPFSVVYDTGFSLDTKKAIIGTLGKRPDISVGIATQDVRDPINSISAETSIMTALRAYARLIPESTMFGTPVTRATFVGHAGTKQYSKYKYQVPLIMSLIKKRARFMGAGNGIMKQTYAYDVGTNRNVDDMSNVSNPWKPETVRSIDWELGLNWVAYANRSSLYFPALQTIYDDDTSVLNSDINMLIAVDVIKMQNEVVRRMQGSTVYTDRQFLDKCNQELADLVEGRYNGRVTIVPNAYYTEADEARGYSWTQEAAIYMNNMRTVGAIVVITRRSSDLTE